MTFRGNFQGIICENREAHAQEYLKRWIVPGSVRRSRWTRQGTQKAGIYEALLQASSPANQQLRVAEKEFFVERVDFGDEILNHVLKNQDSCTDIKRSFLLSETASSY